MSARARFRQILNSPGLSLMPGAYDGLSARIIEEQGFEAVVAGGYAAAGSLLGQPDIGQSNMRDFADHYARICGAVEIPVYADADTGFGSANNVRQMVKAFENGGVAALFFTDQVFPSRCGYLPGKQVIGLEQMLAKVKAALDARTDEAMMICARTDVFALEGEEEAIHRCQAFIEAGADMAKPQGIDTAASVRQVLRQVPGPFIATLSQAAGAEHLSPDELEALGAHAATLPSLPLFAAAKAVRDALRDLKQTRSMAAVQDRLLPVEDYYKVVRLNEQLAREKAYDDEARELVRRST